MTAFDKDLEAVMDALAKATPGHLIIHSEPDVNYPATIHALGNESPVPFHTPIEPLCAWGQEAITLAINFLRNYGDAIREMQGWIVGNGAGDKWRAWSPDGWAVWVDDPEKAVRYARRCDAETIHGDDEDAWRVVRFADALNPKGETQ